MRTMRHLRLIALVILASTGATGAEQAGSTAGRAILSGGVGARPMALGGAYTAVADGPLAIRYNASGLANEDRIRLFAEYSPSFLDINRTNLAISGPMWGGGAGLSFGMIDYGSITRTTVTNKTGAGSFGAADYLLRFAYGRQITERLALGSALGWYHLEIDDITADGIAADLSMTYLTRIDGLQIGAAVRNIGTRAQFERDQEELPLTLTLGTSYRPNHKWLIAADYELARGIAGAIKAGVEFNPVEMLALRLGYDGRNEAGSGLTVGAGFRMNDLALDYAYIPFGDLGEAHRVSLEYAFGGRERPREAASPPQPAPSIAVSRPAVSAPVPAAETPRLEEPRPPRVILSEEPPRPATPTPAELMGQANAKANAGAYAEAAELYRRVLAMMPTDLRAHYNLGTVLYLGHDYAGAARAFGDVVAQDPRDAEAHLYLGLSRWKLGEIQAARQAWETVLRLDPSNEIARANLAAVY